jgi:hypothetical protein
MRVVSGSKVFEAGQFPGQVLRFMNQHRQALRAKGVFSAAIFERQQGNFLGVAATVKAGFFGHGKLLKVGLADYIVFFANPL